jgi:hypothetical protein
MRLFDFNVHLPCKQDRDTQGRLLDEGSLNVVDLRRCYAVHRKALKGNMRGANFMLFNQDIPFGDHAIGQWVSEMRGEWDSAAFTQLLDFRRGGLDHALDRIEDSGIDGVKFHSYVQNIDEAAIPATLAAARLAAARRLFICVDASYGTTRMYDHDNLRLVALLVREIRNVPIIILHSGGARCWEAMLLALEAPNVYLETSFTLPYYRGSSIESDLAFIYRKVGIEKVLYASDFPYVPLDESFECIEQFLDRHRFSSKEKSAILGDNARQLLARMG